MTNILSTFLAEPGLIAWAALIATILVLIVIDLFVVRGKGGEMTLRGAALASVAWVLVSLAFFVALKVWGNSDDANAYLAGYLVEKSLSLDNVFVFLLIFTAFGVVQAERHRLLTYGILMALVMRGFFIVVGAAVLDRFSWVSFIFAGILIWTGWKMFQSRNDHEGEKDRVEKIKARLPITDAQKPGQLSVRNAGKTMLTVSGAALVAIAIADVIFAVDSVPAILAITPVPFIVFAANAFALLGLRPLFFLVAELVEKLRFLKVSLSVLLIFIGSKMLYTAITHVKVGPEISLPAILGILAVGTVASLIWKKPNEKLEP